MSKKNIPDDMIGFKDFLDSEESQKQKSSKRVDNYSYELTSFLEKDATRLDKHIGLFEEKSYMIKEFPQDTKLIVELETQIIEKKIEIINHLKGANSPLTKNLSEILQNHFSS